MEELLNKHRTQPRAEFSRDLYRRLSADEASARTVARKGAINPTLRFGVAALALIIGAGVLLSVPQVSSAAQSFLSLFRVKRITAIAVDPARFQALQNGNLDLETLFAENVEVLKKPNGEPRSVASASEASALAGITVLAPATLADEAKLTGIRVGGETSMRMTADTSKAQAVLQVLGINDVQLPAQLNGAKITISTAPVVQVSYSVARGALMLVQSRSPEIDLPAGVSMAQMGEIALRALGMNADDARAMAAKIDWNTTLLVPIPTNAGSFREVTVRGNTGLLITMNASPARQAGGQPRSQAPMLMWSEGDVVFALSGNVAPTELVNYANALR